MRKSALILTFLSLLPFCQAKTITVDDNAPADFNNIQAAINAFAEGDSIIVADGNYTGTGNRDIINSADPCVKNLIIRSANGPQNCIINCGGSSTSTHCAFNFSDYNKQNSVVIDGFTITNGYGMRGGAIYCYIPMNLEIINCVFVNNKSPATGGAIYTRNCKTFKLKGCSFIGNNAKTFGGGVYCYNSSSLPTEFVFEDCEFSGNSSSFVGGGLFLTSSLPDPIIFNNFKFIGNKAVLGAGLYISEEYVSAKCVNCIFRDNLADLRGGGIYGKGTLANCEFISNTAIEGPGGGMEGSGTFINCIYIGNHSGGTSGGGVYSNGKMINCILWNNTVSETISVEKAQIEILDGKEMKIDYSCIQGWSSLLGGIGNMGLYPFFIDPCNSDPNIRDYHLQVTSPCINTGDPNYIAGVNETDLDGKPRVIGGRIDMGAYEFNHGPVANSGPDQTVYAYINNMADVNLDGSDSNDPDGDALTYKWTWTIDSNTYEANSVNLIIELPVGMHTIELIVNDGIVNSQPDYVDVNVIGPVKAGLKMMPQAINLASKGNSINAYMVLPAGYKVEDVNSNVPLIVEPTGTASKSMNISVNDMGLVCITALFDRGELCGSLNNGNQKLSVVGQFKTGQYFFGSDIIKVIGKKK